jgi:hypothetical protein
LFGQTDLGLEIIPIVTSAPWKFIVNLVELAFKMLGIIISKSPPPLLVTGLSDLRSEF